MNVPFLQKCRHIEHASRNNNDEENTLIITTSGDENSSSSTSGSATFFRTCLNGLNALSGVGILSIPYALASGGWLSIILLFAIAMAAFYSGILMKRCMDSNHNIKTYPEIGHLAFGNLGRTAVSLSMYTELYLVATGFLILEGDNLDNLFPNTEIMGSIIGGKKLFVVVVGIIIMPTVWLDDLSLLSYVSGSGVVASGVIVVAVFVTGVVDESVGFREKGRVVDLGGTPTAVSLYAFCYCAHPVFPSLYNSIKDKKQFSKVLLVCFVLSTAAYAFMAIIGYLMFGSKVESQITLNLPKNKITSQIAIYTTLLNPIAKYALMVTPITNALKSLLPPQHMNNRFITISISTALVFSTVAVAVAVPFFGSLTSLVGAFLSVTASIIMPCACYLKISGTYKELGFETVAIVTIILIGVVIGVFGTYNALAEIINQL
ncbi:hypothetical protein PIB30_089991 [Stylosanthes scabra]|uniref:Amino acid transporter transmembrane domain-containing protein n=1 Tax=Stylosanthes scabra TaxID=79078 RepID=A0ABU6XV97_9FABA|nr:hypothetical protein [Stylosanthes scabra]